MLLAALLAVAGVALLPVAPAASAEPVTTQISPLIVVMDVSGSMTTPADNDPARTRLDVARDAVLQTVASRVHRSPFGLIAYPGEGTRTIDGCSVGAEEVKLGPLDRAAASAAVRRLTATGGTPTGPALRNAADILKNAGGRGTILLVSDGEANCGDDPCAVAEEIAREGLSIRAHSVGFNINESGRDELKCVASQLGGQYADANDDLGSVIEDLSGPKLSIDVDLPWTMGDVAGTGTSGNAVTVTATNIGKARADDVRVSLDFRDATGSPGALPVDKPVHVIGNLEPNSPTQVTFTVRPPLGTRGDFRAYAYVSARNAAPKKDDSKTTEVIDGTTTLTGILSRVNRVAVLGDSYSSGEGAGNYHSDTMGFAPEPGIPDSGNLCHRSDRNYGSKLVGQAGTVTIACSGAVTSDFYSRQKSGDVEVRPQLERLRALNESAKRPDAVLLSVGGNDVGFAGVVSACVTRQFCDNKTFMAQVDSSLLFSDLVRVYRDTDRALNGVVDGERAPGVEKPIVVVPYPRIVPTTARALSANGVAAPQYCVLGVSQSETVLLNEMVDHLNSQIKLAVQALRGEGRPVYYASDVVEAMQPDHTVCDREPHAVGKVLDNVVFNKSEIAHPNEDGHADMASAIAAWSRSATKVDPGEGPVYWNTTTEPNEGVMRKLGDWMARPFENWVNRIDGGSAIASEGFDPDSQVVFRIRSTPRVIGSAWTDSAGRVSSTVWIPADMEPGRHHIEVVGVDENGHARTQSRSVLLVPQYTPIAVLGLVIGLILVGVAWIAIRRARKRDRDVADDMA